MPLVFAQEKEPRILGPMYEGISKIITKVVDGKILKFKAQEERKKTEGRITRKLVIKTQEVHLNPYLLEGTGESFLSAYRGLGQRGQGALVPDQALKFFLDFPSELDEGKKNAFRVRRHNGEDVIVVIWKEGKNSLGSKYDIRSPKIWLPEDNIVFWIPCLITSFP